VKVKVPDGVRDLKIEAPYPHRKLANEIVGDETNPVLAARKLYDWVLVNVDYWVKDPKNKPGSAPRPVLPSAGASPDARAHRSRRPAGHAR
jgi:hypothetical protein